MARLTDQNEKNAAPGANYLVHVVDPADTTNNPAGTSFKMKVSNLVGAFAETLGFRDRSTHTGSQLANTISDFATATDARISNHVAQADPHTQYQKESEKAAANGYASLDGTGKIPTAQLPALALTDVFVVASQVAQLALTAEEGDVAVRTDQNKSYIHNGGVAGTMADWSELLTPTDTVISVAGKSGAVSLVKADVGLGNVDNTSDANKPVSTAQASANAAVQAFAIQRGNHTGTQLAATISDFASAVRGTVLTGLSLASATVISATDTVLVALGSLQKQITDLTTAVASKVVSVSAGTNVSITGTGVAPVVNVPTMTATVGGAVPTPPNNTTAFLRGDGTFATPTASAAPAGSTTQVQYNNAGATGGASKTTINANGSLELVDDNSPLTPPAGELGLVSKQWGVSSPTVINPDGFQTLLQNHLGRNALSFHIPLGATTTASGGINIVAVGTATAAAIATTNFFTMTRRIDYLVTVAAATAVAGWRGGASMFAIGHASNPLLGGFRFYQKWGPATGIATASATHRAFVGLIASISNPTDVNPSTQVSCCGMGWDSGDTNVQFMHNDATGTCTKIDLGANFPRPSADRTDVYELYLYAPRGTTQSVSYRVVNLTTGNEASGTVTTDLPATTALLCQRNYVSVGGTSSVIGFTHMGCTIETPY